VEVRLRLPDAQRAVVAIGKPSTTLNGSDLNAAGAAR
jgi:hypothetical protein